MEFKEMSEVEQTNYIIKSFTTAVKISKTLPKVGPRSIYGIYNNMSDRDSVVDRFYTKEDFTIFEIVLFEWREAFVIKGGILPIWKRLWIIFDEDMPRKKKERILGIKKTYIYSNRDQGIELIRKYLLRR